jgi:hypothetical protein
MKATYNLTALSLAIALSLAGCSRHYGLTSQELETQIARELSEGSDATKIFSFLDKNRIEHTAVLDMSAELLDDPSGDTFFNDPKLEGKRGRVKKQIAAKVPDVKYGFMTSFDIFIRFYLDDESKLVGSVVKTIGTGL